MVKDGEIVSLLEYPYRYFLCIVYEVLCNGRIYSYIFVIKLFVTCLRYICVTLRGELWIPMRTYEVFPQSLLDIYGSFSTNFGSLPPIQVKT